MWILPDLYVCGDDCPVTFTAESFDPIPIGNVRRESLPQMDSAMAIRLNKLMNSRRELRWQIVVEEEPQAALFGPSCSSNLTAARTADGFTANQRATRSTEPSATTASARIVVGTPSPFVIGCPNARNGSITMRSEEQTSELQSLMRHSY